MKQIVSRPLQFISPSGITRVFLYILVRLIYRIRSKGAENFPCQGGVLLISNHVSYVDAFLLQAVSPRYIHFVASEHFLEKWWLAWALRMMEIVPISSVRPKRAIQTVVQKLKEGEVVCIFPEGTLSRTGNLQGFQKGFEVIARQAGVPVVLAGIDGIWGSVFSFSNSRFFWKRPLPHGHRIVVAFGPALYGEAIERGRAWQAMLELLAQTFSEREEFSGHLAREAVKSLGRAPWKAQIIDPSPERRVLSRGGVLALAIVLSRRWRKTRPEKRIGILLPPGKAATITSLALALLDKTAVSLDFRLDKESLQSCCRQAELETTLSTTGIQKQLEGLGWRGKTVDLPRELQTCGKASMLVWLIAVWLLPSRLLIRLIGIPQKGDQKEAALLFTGDSPGQVKGVPLTHRNLLAIRRQFSETTLLKPDDSLLAALPTSDIRGFTVALWLPLLKGIPIVTPPPPPFADADMRTISKEKVTLLLGSPAFLRTYLQNTPADDRCPLRLLLGEGGFSLPDDLRKLLQERDHIQVLEGYGWAETTGVTAFSIPDPEGRTADGGRQVGTRPGSVGRLLPGMSARLLDPGTRKEHPSLLSGGLLALRGPNLFPGYLENNENPKADSARKPHKSATAAPQAASGRLSTDCSDRKGADPSITIHRCRATPLTQLPDPKEKGGEISAPGEQYFLTEELARFDRDGFLFIGHGP